MLGRLNMVVLLVTKAPGKSYSSQLRVVAHADVGIPCLGEVLRLESCLSLSPLKAAGLSGAGSGG